MHLGVWEDACLHDRSAERRQNSEMACKYHLTLIFQHEHHHVCSNLKRKRWPRFAYTYSWYSQNRMQSVTVLGFVYE